MEGPKKFPGQLSLAIPLCVDAMSTSKSCDVNKHSILHDALAPYAV